MKTTADFLDDLQKKLGVESDYALGKAMGMQRQHVSHYRTLKTTFDDEKCVKIAELLDIDAAEIILAMHYQRAKQPEVKAIWERMAVSMAAMAATVVLSLPIVTMTGIETASTPYNDGGSVYIMLNEFFPDA